MILDVEFIENSKELNADFSESEQRIDAEFESVIVTGDNTEASYNEGYAAGRKAEHDRFWDAFQRNGTRTNYERGFYRWDLNGCYPKYDIRPTNAEYIFNLTVGKVDLATRFKDCGVVFDTSNATSVIYMFYDTEITHLPEINTQSATNLTGLFYRADDLITIDKLKLKNDGSQTFSNAFVTSSLKNIVVEGVIGQNFGLTYAPLTRESLLSFFNALKDYSTDTSGTTHKASLGSKNIAKLTAEEIAIAKNKGWDVV